MSYYEASTYIQYHFIHTTYATLYFMSYYFLPQRYKRNYVLFMKVENDLKHTSPDAIHATRLSHNIDNHPEVRYRTPHFTAAIIELHLIYKLERATVDVNLKCSTTTLKIIIQTE